MNVWLDFYEGLFIELGVMFPLVALGSMSNTDGSGRLASARSADGP